MNDKLFFQIINISYYIIISFQLINKINSYVHFKYPYGITLTNQNVFIVHQLGIDIIDAQFTKIIKNVLTFSEEEKIKTENELSKIEIKYKDGYILSLINDKIYIFNNTGDFLNKSDDKITEDESIEYYTLVPIEKVYTGIYYFLIGFFDTNNYLNLNYYKYNIQNNIIKRIHQKVDIRFKNNNNYYFQFKNKGLSCEYMYYSFDYPTINILSCYFIYESSANKYLTVGYYSIITDQEIKNYYYLNNPTLTVNNALFIKSALNLYKDSSLVSFYDQIDDKVFFIKFNINDQSFSSKISYVKKCRDKIYGLKVNYISKTSMISLSCIDYDGSIQVDFFDNEIYSSLATSIKQFISCEKIYGHSILYLSNSLEYYILSDVECNKTEYLLQELESNILNDYSKITEEQETQTEKTEETTEETKTEEATEETSEESKTDEIEKVEETENTEKIEIGNCDELKKCETYNKDSIKENLCITCNEKENYYPKKIPSNKKIYIPNKYINCYNEETKPYNFYFNQKTKYYEPCFENCATCKYGGDENENNCTSCEGNYIFSPDINGTNCVEKCTYFYYYNEYVDYSCTQKNECPKDYNYLIRDKGKCTNDCKRENGYQYLYNRECLKQCPENTKDNNDYICKDINLNICSLNKKILYSFNENNFENEVQKYVEEYIKDFSYSKNHVTLYENNIYSITIYKNGECIDLLNITIPEVNFLQCYEKIQNQYSINEDLVIAIISKNENGKKSTETISYSMYEPKKGKTLNMSICEGEKIVKKVNLKNKLEDNNINMTSLLMLTEQNINVFNKSSSFYTDICYHFEMPVKKDIALKDRILIYFPNITLCEGDCKTIGVNLTTLKAMCECKFSNLKKQNILEDNLMYQSAVGEITDLLSHTNIEIIKCYKDVFTYKFFISNIGGFIILFFISIQIIVLIIHLKKGLYSVKKFIFEITNKYISFISLQKDNSVIPNTKIQNNSKNYPPRKKGIMKENKESKGLNIIHNMENAKRRRKRGLSTKKVNFHFSLKLNDNVNKLGSNDINTFSNNILVSNDKYNSIDKIYPINNNKQNIRSKNSILKNGSINNNSIFDSNLIINLKDNISINIEEYLNTDPDDMDYDDAIKKDKRKFRDYFIDRLKTNQILLNTFYYSEPIRPRTIKILLLILNIDLYFFINGLFFNEEYISDIFHSNDDESFSDFVFRFTENCFYTTFVGVFVNYIIDCFFVEEKKIKGILKREKDNLIILNYEITQLIRGIQKRYKYFIIISFVITIFTWYYASCFNNIYPYTKGEWIKTSVMVIIVMQILSILASLLESIIRYFSFKCKSEKLYGIIHWLS